MVIQEKAWIKTFQWYKQAYNSTYEGLNKGHNLHKDSNLEVNKKVSNIKSL